VVDEEKTPVNDEEEAAPEQERIPIDDRIKQLTEAGVTDKNQLVLTLYQEGYSTHLIMKRHLPLKALKRKKEKQEQSVLGAIEGGVKGPGYLEEFKNMIRSQISRTKDLTDEFYNLGFGVLLASLQKSGLTVEEFRKIVTKEGSLKAAFKRAGETAFKALEYYQSDLVTNVEKERDEARAYSAILESRIAEVKRNIDPKVRLEKMIYNLVLLSGTVKIDPNALSDLLDRWLRLEVIAA